MTTTMPTHARVVIIGGGIVGCSVAYHLAKLGWSDVVLLEQGQLSCGTTWHAAGLVGQLRSHENTTRLIRYSTDLYSRLEAETGQATGWRQCGSLSVARTEDRMILLRRTAALARAQGVPVEILDPGEALRRWPIMRTDDLCGAVWLPGDGKANPSDLTQALAKGARLGGVRIVEGARVRQISLKQGAVSAVKTQDAEIQCEIVVNCAGQWAKAVGRLCGVMVPLHSAEHMYIVTGKIDGASPDLPVLRDPDGYVYFKEEVGGLVVGGFEPEASPWGMDGIPEDFAFELLPDNWEQFEILIENALIRVPALKTAEIKQFLNGPESFTPDNNFILGEAPEVRNFFVAAGFNSMGIASAGGAGAALAEWIVEKQPTMDLWPVDIRRFHRSNASESWLHDRVKETLGLHYAMSWPNREFEMARGVRRSPLYATLKERGACFGSKMGWERALWFANPGDEPVLTYGWTRQPWFENAAREHESARGGVVVFDQTSFSKFLLQGKDAESALQSICANNVSVAPGSVVYTGILNERGGYESDVTVTRLDGDSYLIVSGTAQSTRDFDWISKSISDAAHAVLTDVTSAYAVLGVMGPRSRDLLSRATRMALDNDSFPFGTSREIELGYAMVRASRITYVGELGWEVYIPSECAAGVYETLLKVGEELGLVDAGYYALESLRIEKGYRAWGRELTPDYTPLEAGLAFAVDFDKPTGFTGRDALLRQREEGVKRRLILLTMEDPTLDLYGGELVLRDGVPVGELKSAAFGHTLSTGIGMAYVESKDRAVDKDFVLSGAYQVDVGGRLSAAKPHLRTPYDPKARRPRDLSAQEER
ncbi:MAG: FAD-dependent oxidoreductase [Kiloniellales bacterium]|nr:FAD-dependent oxidoreductase [Kiloniellales bacterium]